MLRMARSWARSTCVRCIAMGFSRSDSSVVGVVEEREQEQRRRDHRDDGADQQRLCSSARSPLSAKKSMKAPMIAAVRKSTIHSGVGTTPCAAWFRSWPSRSAPRSSGRAISRTRPPRLDRSASTCWSVLEYGHAPGVEPVALGARPSRRGQARFYDVAGVAEEAIRQFLPLRGRHELRGLELLRDLYERFRLGAHCFVLS